MAVNPIFPLYYNDIDRSTRDWTDEEFGCYMRLLMHQWDKGEIPKDPQRLSRIVTSLGSSWVTVGLKFVETGTGLQNEKLEEIRAERNSFLKKQQENGKKGGRKPRINPDTNPDTKPNQSLQNEDEDEKEDEIEIEKENSFRKSENLLNGSQLIPTICRNWYNTFPTYTKDQDQDFKAAMQIVSFMQRQHAITDISDSNSRELILATMEQIGDCVTKDTFWLNKPLKSIANNIQEFYNKIKNPQKNGKEQQTREQFHASVQDEFKKRYPVQQSA